MNPFGGEVITSFASSIADDVDAADISARAAFESAVRYDPYLCERKTVLARFADLVDEHVEVFTTMAALGAGNPITECRDIDVPETASSSHWRGDAQYKP